MFLNVLVVILLTVTAVAGPLTIQTQEAVWTNGMDTITLGAASFDIGDPAAIPYEVVIAPDAAVRSIAYPLTLPATLDATPFDLVLGGIFSANGGFMFAANIAPAAQLLVGDTLFSIGGTTGLQTGSTGQTITGNLNLQSVILAPEPSTWIMLTGGLLAIGYAKRGNKPRLR